MVTKPLTFYAFNTIMLTMILIFSSATSYADKIYTWIDKSGVTHFSSNNNGKLEVKSISDTPKNIVKTNNLQNKNTTLQNTSSSATISKTKAEATKQPINFTLSILKPINNSTIQNPRATTIAVELSGYQSIFAGNGYIALNVDNKVNRTFTNGNSFYINAPSRGQHALKAIAYSAEGALIATSQPVTFFVQNTSARATAGSTQITNTLYENQTTKNYTKFQKAHENSLINPKAYNAGFVPTAKVYQTQVTGN